LICYPKVILWLDCFLLPFLNGHLRRQQRLSEH
jgi:hypothetical protein